MLRSIYILLPLLIFPLLSSAQKVQKISGEYTYSAPGTISPESAKRTALERARLTALADAFGTYIYQHNMLLAENKNGVSGIDFQSLGGCEVKGEWISDIKEPEIEVLGYRDNMLIVHAKVWGNAREIASAPIDLTAKILRNGTDPKFESTQFRTGDDLFLYFKSPTDGYLAVYLVDNTNTAYCLLPYSGDPDGKTEIKNGREYIFFSAQDAGNETRSLVDEYTMTCEGTFERNDLYLIFSPNEFIKAGDIGAVGKNLPRQLSFRDFQKWLSKNRLLDPQLTLMQQAIMIKK